MADTKTLPTNCLPFEHTIVQKTLSKVLSSWVHDLPGFERGDLISEAWMIWNKLAEKQYESPHKFVATFKLSVVRKFIKLKNTAKTLRYPTAIDATESEDTKSVVLSDTNSEERVCELMQICFNPELKALIGKYLTEQQTVQVYFNKRKDYQKILNRRSRFDAA